MKRHIPNFITTLNLACGVISVTEVIHGNLEWAALFIFLAAVFDYLDGTAARILNARSEIGKQLDSLADVVSFGVAPGLIMFQLLMAHFDAGGNMPEKFHFIPYLALLIPIGSALRLAKFNLDTRQEVNFIGLPTPGNALFFASIPLILLLPAESLSLISLPFLVDFFSGIKVQVILTVFFSYLLISDYRLFSMKFKSLKMEGNQSRYLFLGISLILCILFSYQAIPFIIGVYLFLSLAFQKSMGS